MIKGKKIDRVVLTLVVCAANYSATSGSIPKPNMEVWESGIDRNTETALNYKSN